MSEVIGVGEKQSVGLFAYDPTKTKISFAGKLIFGLAANTKYTRKETEGAEFHIIHLTALSDGINAILEVPQKSGMLDIRIHTGIGHIDIDTYVRFIKFEVDEISDDVPVVKAIFKKV